MYEAQFMDHCPACMERGALVVVKATVVSSEQVVYPHAPLLASGWGNEEDTGDEEIQCAKCFRIYALFELRLENSAELKPRPGVDEARKPEERPTARGPFFSNNC